MAHPGGRPRKNLQMPANAVPDTIYLTVPEAAALTNSHVRTVQARLRDGTLKGKKISGTWRIYRESLFNEKVVSDPNPERR